MNPIIVDATPFHIDLDHLLKVLHIEHDDDDAAKVKHLAAEAQAVARPRGMFGEAYVEARGDDHIIANGIRFTSRVLSVNLAGIHRVFPFIATCGSELDDWSASITDMFHRYWADKIKETVLGHAIRAVNQRMAEHFNLKATATMNPGSLEDWPIYQQRQLFELLGWPADAIGVHLSESFLMIPTKSISGLRFPTEVTFENCQLCPRDQCPGRRAPYDESLFDRKYRKQA